MMREEFNEIKWMREDIPETERSWLEFMIYDETEIGYDAIGLIGEGMVVNNKEIPEILEWWSLIAEKEEVVIGVLYAPASFEEVSFNNPFGIEYIVQIGKKNRRYMLAFLNLKVVPAECRARFWSEMGIIDEELEKHS